MGRKQPTNYRGYDPFTKYHGHPSKNVLLKMVKLRMFFFVIWAGNTQRILGCCALTCPYHPWDWYIYLQLP